MKVIFTSVLLLLVCLLWSNKHKGGASSSYHADTVDDGPSIREKHGLRKADDPEGEEQRNLGLSCYSPTDCDAPTATCDPTCTNGVCGWDCDDDDHCLERPEICYMQNLLCNRETGSCVDYLGLGEGTCYEDCDCTSCYTLLECSSGKTCLLRFQATGCSEDSHCSDGLACASGTCLKEEGNQCSNDNSCASSRCENGVCMVKEGLGGSCTDHTDCESGLTCRYDQCKKDPGSECVGADDCHFGDCDNNVCPACGAGAYRYPEGESASSVCVHAATYNEILSMGVKNDNRWLHHFTFDGEAIYEEVDFGSQNLFNSVRLRYAKDDKLEANEFEISVWIDTPEDGSPSYWQRLTTFVPVPTGGWQNYDIREQPLDAVGAAFLHGKRTIRLKGVGKFGTPSFKHDICNLDWFEFFGYECAPLRVEGEAYSSKNNLVQTSAFGSYLNFFQTGGSTEYKTTLGLGRTRVESCSFAYSRFVGPNPSTIDVEVFDATGIPAQWRTLCSLSPTNTNDWKQYRVEDVPADSAVAAIVESSLVEMDMKIVGGGPANFVANLDWFSLATTPVRTDGGYKPARVEAEDFCTGGNCDPNVLRFAPGDRHFKYMLDFDENFILDFDLFGEYDTVRISYSKGDNDISVFSVQVRDTNWGDSYHTVLGTFHLDFTGSWDYYLTTEVYIHPRAAELLKGQGENREIILQAGSFGGGVQVDYFELIPSSP